MRGPPRESLKRAHFQKYDQSETGVSAVSDISRESDTRCSSIPTPQGGVLTIGGVAEVVACLANELILLDFANLPISEPMMSQLMTRALQFAEFRLHGR